MVSCSRAGWLEVGVGAVPHTVIQGVRLSLRLPRGSAVLGGPGVPTAPFHPGRRAEEARAGASNGGGGGGGRGGLVRAHAREWPPASAHSPYSRTQPHGPTQPHRVRGGRPGGFGLAVCAGGKADRTASPQPSFSLAERMEDVKFTEWLSAFLSLPETGTMLHHGASL